MILGVPRSSPGNCRQGEESPQLWSWGLSYFDMIWASKKILVDVLLGREARAAKWLIELGDRGESAIFAVK